MINRLRTFKVLLFGFLFPIAATGPALGAEGDAICAFEQAIACSQSEVCERNLPGSVNLPSLFKLDVENGLILSKTSDGTERSSKVGGSTKLEDALILQGIDEGRPWSIRIDHPSGRFTMSSVRVNEGFVAFGVCSWSLLE